MRTYFIAGLIGCGAADPEGMAYAQLAGVPPEAAFYAAPIGLLLFAFLALRASCVVAVSSALPRCRLLQSSAFAIPDTSEFIVLMPPWPC